MTEQHPITPPPELVRQWTKECSSYDVPADHIATQAARWGADQELELCCMWLSREVCDGWGLRQQLRASRRPKPSSLKEQALKALKNIDDACESEGFSRSDDTNTIRRALEQLDD